MYIGACKDCREYCQQNSSSSFEKEHAKQKHIILPLKSFNEDNEDYIYKIQKRWHYFDKELQNFFTALRKKIDLIQSEARQRVKEQQLKTAANSNERRLIELSRDIFNEKYQKLTCKEINQFIQIKNSLTKSNNFPQISSKEQNFSFDIMDEIKRSVYELGKKLAQVKRKQQKTERRQPRNNEHNKNEKAEDRRQNGNRDNRQFHNRKDKAQVTPQQEKGRRQGNQRGTRQGRQQRRPRDDREGRRPRDDREQRKPRQDRQQNTRRQGREQRRPRQGRQERKPRQDRQERKPRQDRQERKPRQNREGQRQRRGQHRERTDNRQWHDNRNQKEKQTKTYPKLKIIELKNDSDEFSIDLKMLSLWKVVRGRDVWKVSDETGEIKLVIPNHQSFKTGVNITLNNVYAKEHGNQLQIVAKLYSTITSTQIGNNVDVGTFNKNTIKRPRPKPTGISYPNFVKINDLQPDTQNFKMLAKVISVKKIGLFMQCIIGDETGIANARFKSGGQFVKQGNSIYCRGLTVVMTQSGCILVTEGNKFLIQNARQQVKNIKLQNNVSEREYEAEDD